MDPRRSVKKYKQTIFDKYGPDAGNLVITFSYSLIAFGVSIPMFAAAGYKLVEDRVLPAGWAVIWSLDCTFTMGCLVMLGGLWLSSAGAGAMHEVVLSGNSTPYKEQYSVQQALVMQGRVGEALASFETVIVANPREIDARVKAAELYAREGANPRRAAELFREVQAMVNLEVGQDVYVSHRLVDLYTGPLGEPGRALVELRKLIDRHAESPAAARAREALATLKAEYVPAEPKTVDDSERV